ncbi:hypothetical protein ACFV1W_05535 [Kitasatospora sp. NPDC059648]|uniref:hypothetical protein n=1 Tax=Kitasatospora sp. NPDC059648 TaxID=3346894 RepID=UPI0036CFA4CB
MILVPVAVPRTAPAFRRVIDPEQRPSVRAGLTVETLPPGVRVDQLPCESVESATVVLAGRLSAGGRILSPGEVLHHPPGSRHRLTALCGAPTAVLTVRPVLAAAELPAQRTGSRPAGPERRITVDTVVLPPPARPAGRSPRPRPTPFCCRSPAPGPTWSPRAAKYPSSQVTWCTSGRASGTACGPVRAGR